MAEKITDSFDDTFAPGVEYLFRKHSKDRESGKFKKEKPALQKAAILTGLFVILFFYFMIPASRIHSVTVSGNHFLTDDYVRSLSGIKRNDIFYLVFPPYISYKVETDPLVESASVSLNENNRIVIEVKEKKVVGYRYDEKGWLLFADGTETELQSEFLDVIAKVPFITGFEEPEQKRLLAKAFANIDDSVIANISEIREYPMPYDEDAMVIVMRDGAFVIADYYNTDIINRYNEIYSRLKNKKQCIYAVAKEYQAAAYTSECPWDKKETEREYWRDENGKIITNSYGDLAIKHFYYDKEGKYARDENGDKIPVPINEKGDEVRDLDFVEHYEAGYYKTGVLVIPEEEPDGEESKSEEPKSE